MKTGKIAYLIRECVSIDDTDVMLIHEIKLCRLHDIFNSLLLPNF